ncbi:LPD38 domain-containing protein [Aeromonas hydrophila]|uniref:LPD38 domain-containing protein n=1 Tax=Aeromonas hydrophila TaxID=644 RepID=UPI000B2664F5|nr:LPD38 domain-containing protein [Aeromonas hydrophila]
MAQFTREDFMRDAMARYSSAAKPDPKQDEQGIIMDGIDMFQRGLGQTLGGDLETVGQLTGSQGVKDAGRGVSAWADGQLQEASTPMREAMGKQFFQENAETGAIEAGDAWADPRAWAGNFSTVLGQFVGLVGGTKGAGVLAKPALRGAGKLLAKDLVEGQARELVAKATVKDAISAGALDSVRSAYLAAPGEAAKRAVLDKAIGRLTSIGYGAHAGAMASGMRAQQAEQEARGYFNALGNDELNANPIYQQAYWELADGEMQGASIGDIRRAAIDSVAEKAATDAWSDPRALTADFLSGMLTGAGGGVGGLLGKVGTTRAGAAVRGFAGEGATEAWQGGETQRAVNQAVQEWADETRDPMAGVLSAALNEGTLGGAFGGVVGGVHGPQAPDIAKPVVRVERRVVTGDERMDDMIHGLDQRQAERGASISSEIDSMFAGANNPLGSGKFDPVRDIPAFQRQGFVRGGHDFRGKPIVPLEGELLDPATTVVTTPSGPLPDMGGQATGAAGELAAITDQRISGELQDEATLPRPQANLLAGATYDGESREVGADLPVPRSPAPELAAPIRTEPAPPPESVRLTRRGLPFSSEKEAALASRQDEIPIPLDGGGFGIAKTAEEVERVRGGQTAALPQESGQQVIDNTAQQPLAQAIDTGYREEIPATQPQAEVSNEQAPQVLAVGSEGQGDQLGTGEPAAAGAEPAIAGLTDRAGAGDRADLLASPPVPDGQQQNDQALTAPATDAGVVVSEVMQPEPAVQEPAAAPTPWEEAIDNPDGTITLKGEMPLIKQWAKDSGVKAIPGKGGMVVAKSSAAKVRGYLSPAASEPAQQIEAARAEVALDPTEAQKEAGNYKKGHLTLQGMDIALENPKGSTRSGTDQDGKAWQSTMAHDYGYIKRTLGADGDHVDVFIGDRPDSEMVYVVDQVDPKTGKFDEHKVMMGFASEPAARDGYLANYEKGWKGLSAIKAMPVEEFKRWVKEGDTTKPIADAAPAQEEGRGNAQDDKPVKVPERSISFSKQAMAQGDKPAKALTRKEAELVTKGWFKQYRGASGIDVQIHATQAELETALGLTAKDGLIRRAAFDDDTGTLHVAADTIANPKRMREILRHEVLAHYGLANVLGDGEYTKLISRLIKSKKDPSMRPVWDWVNTHYADEDIGVQAEEVVAHLAELEMGSWGRGWDRVVAWVTRALRAVGFVPDGITAAETRTLIEGLGKKMRRADGGMVTAEGDRLWFSAERSPWGKDFPEVILHGRLADATGHPDYAAAKGGDDAAARRLVSDVLSPDAIKQLKKVIGNREAIALGVHAEEAVSRNAIPSAMADILGKVLGIEVDLDIMQAAKVGRTAQDGFGRLANQPSFDGAVRADKPYLIMDDTLTQGGTLANLKGYIENRGGEVLAATALTGKQYSAKIAIDSSTLEQLRDQYDGTGLEAWWHNRFGYGFDSLTESEGRYLLRAKDADKVRGRVTATGPQAPARGEHESARDDGSLPPDGLKFSQSNTAADDALQKLNLGPKPDIIDKTKTNLDKLRKAERSVVKSWLDRFIKKANTEVLDALAPIKYAEDAAGITDAADSGYVAARMATGAASTMQATMLYGLPEWKDGVIQKKAGTGEKDALLGIFSDLGADLHNWLGWMAGHRAELLMEQGRENLLSEQDIAALKGLGKGKEAKFMEAKARWNRLNAATLDLAQEAGLFTKEARAEFESEWYIPFFRESDDGDVIAPFKPKGIANQNAGIKKLKGGEANTNDLLENIFTSTSKLIDASMKNMAAQKTVWNLADTGLIEVVAKPNMMDWRALKNGKDLITVKLEGEDYMIRVDDPDLYRAMTFFDRHPFGAMVNVAAKAKRLLTAGVTASPEFMLRNFLRDSLSSWAISKDGFKPVIDSIKGVKKTLAMEGSTIDVMFSGASFLGGYVNGNDPTAMADSVRKSLRRKGMTPEQISKYEKSIVRNAAQVKGVVADVWDKYSRYGEALENANREAVYAAAIKAGKSHAQAAFESKDLMDFSMLGGARFIQGASMVLPFFNARIQGLGKLSRELRDNPREIAKRAGMITAMSLGLLAMNWDDERYEELPDWDKDANWHFFVGDQHFRIPKPFEIGVMFGTIPERMVRAMGGKDTGAQLGKAVARAIGETFALNPTPQIVKPLVESYFNYDSFRGGPIENAQDLAVKAEARYNEQTSLLMRELGEAMGMSPKKLEHLLIGYTGTIGGYVMATADGLIRAAQPGESASWRADEIPLVKAVYRGTGPAKSTQHMEQFYQMLNEVNQLKRTVDQYRSEGLTDKANELLDEQGGILKSRSSLSRTQQQVRVVRNRIELIQRDRTLAAEEKRRRIDELLSRRNDLVYQAVNNNRKNWE